MDANHQLPKQGRYEPSCNEAVKVVWSERIAVGGINFDGNPVVGPALACTAAAQRVTGRQQMWTESSKTSQEAVATNFRTGGFLETPHKPEVWRINTKKRPARTSQQTIGETHGANSMVAASQGQRAVAPTTRANDFAASPRYAEANTGTPDAGLLMVALWVGPRRGQLLP